MCEEAIRGTRLFHNVQLLRFASGIVIHIRRDAVIPRQFQNILQSMMQEFRCCYDTRAAAFEMFFIQKSKHVSDRCLNEDRLARHLWFLRKII